MGAAERDPHARPVHTARGHVGREVDDQRCIATQALEIRQFMKLHPVDGFIAAQVYIAGALAQLPRRGCGQGGEPGLLSRGRNARFRCVLERFFLRLLAPAARHHKVHRRCAREIQRNDGVFRQATTLHEQDLEIGRHRQQFAQIGFGLLVNRDEFLAPVAHLHHAHTTAVPVEHFSSGLFKDFGRNGSRAGGEVVGAVHRLMIKRASSAC